MKNRIAFVAIAGVFLVRGTCLAEAQATYAIVNFSTGGVSGSSTGGVYSVRRTTGLGDFHRMCNADYAVGGNFWPGMILRPELAAGGFYVGIDLHDPIQALADYDGDGLSNLAEFGLGTDPYNPADSALALLITVTADSGNQFLTMQFKRRTNAGSLGLQYWPEVSADGLTWHSDQAHVQEIGSVALDSQFELVTVRDLTATALDGPRFIRLHVTEN